MEVVLANTIKRSRSPVTDSDGGTSAGDPGAGSADIGRKDRAFAPVSTAEKAGAYILTVLAIFGLISGSVFVMLDENDHSSTSELFAKLSSVCITAGGSLLQLPRRNGSSQPKEKGADLSSSDGYQQAVPGSRSRLVVHSCVRTTQVSPSPVPRAHSRPTWRNRQSETEHRRGGYMEQNISYPRSNGGYAVSRETPFDRDRGRRIGRVHRLETSWEEE